MKQLDDTYSFTTRIDEVARIVARRMGYESLADIKYWPAEQRNYFQWRVFTSQVESEVEAGSDFISDRCVLDNLAYAIYYNCPNATIDGMEEFARLHVKTYDLILHLPIPNELIMAETKDGFRMTDFSSLQRVDSILAGCIEDARFFGAEVMELGEKRADWYQEAISCIKEYDPERAGVL